MNKIRKIYLWFKERWTAKNSNLGKFVQWLSVAMIAIGTIGTNGQIQVSQFPEKLQFLGEYFQYMIFIGFLGANLAQLSKKKEEQKKE